jgi:hypothetical protein
MPASLQEMQLKGVHNFSATEGIVENIISKMIIFDIVRLPSDQNAEKTEGSSFGPPISHSSNENESGGHETKKNSSTKKTEYRC